MEFIRLGRKRLAVSAIKAVVEETDGTAVVHYNGGGVEALCTEDAAAVLAWADAHSGTPAPPAPKKGPLRTA